EPQILLLDEPTASLDPAATKAIEDVIRKVAASGIKVVMSTHDLGEAKRLAGEIVLVHRGRVIESGPADAFFSAPKTEEARRFAAGVSLFAPSTVSCAAHERKTSARPAVAWSFWRRPSRSSAPHPPARRTNPLWSPPPRRHRTPACSATSCRCLKPRPASM